MMDDYAIAKLNEKRERRRRQKQKCLNCIKSVIAFLFSHIGLASMVVAYSIVGGFLFKALEAPFEIKVKHRITNFKDKHVKDILILAANVQLNRINDTNFTGNIHKIFNDFQRQVYVAVKENGWDGIDSTEESVLQWSFAGALLYSVTVITTIGYGHIAPKTTAGRFVTILYALVGIPLTFLYLSNIGNFLADCFRVFYKNICCDLCCCQKCERKKKRERMRLKRQRACQKNSLLLHKLPSSIHSSSIHSKSIPSNELDPECQSLVDIDSPSIDKKDYSLDESHDYLSNNSEDIEQAAGGTQFDDELYDSKYKNTHPSIKLNDRYHSNSDKQLIKTSNESDDDIKETPIMGDINDNEIITGHNFYNLYDFDSNKLSKSFFDNLRFLADARETAIIDDSLHSSDEELFLPAESNIQNSSINARDDLLTTKNTNLLKTPKLSTNSSIDNDLTRTTNSSTKSTKLSASSSFNEEKKDKSKLNNGKRNKHEKSNEVSIDLSDKIEDLVEYEDNTAQNADKENLINEKHSKDSSKSKNKSEKSKKNKKNDTNGFKNETLKKRKPSLETKSKLNDNEGKNKTENENRKKKESDEKRNKEKSKTLEKDKGKDKHLSREKSKSINRKSVKHSSDPSPGSDGRRPSFVVRDKNWTPRNSIKQSDECSKHSSSPIVKGTSSRRKRELSRSMRQSRPNRRTLRTKNRHSKSAEELHKLYDKDKSIVRSDESFFTAKSESFPVDDALSRLQNSDVVSSKNTESTKTIEDSSVVKFQPESVTISIDNTYHEDVNLMEYQNAIGLEDPFDFDDDDRGEKVTVPISICLVIIAGYIFAGSVLFTLWEDWDYLTGSYFCFITLSTIGFGDIVPGVGAQDWSSHEKLVLCALWLAFGLSLLAMCFNLMQEEVKEKCKWIGIKLGLLKSEDDG